MFYSSVTEVVWEGEETEAKKADSVTAKKADNNGSTNAFNRSVLFLFIIHIFKLNDWKQPILQKAE